LELDPHHVPTSLRHVQNEYDIHPVVEVPRRRVVKNAGIASLDGEWPCGVLTGLVADA
jgi:hypothetical protein